MGIRSYAYASPVSDTQLLRPNAGRRLIIVSCSDLGLVRMALGPQRGNSIDLFLQTNRNLVLGINVYGSLLCSSLWSFAVVPTGTVIVTEVFLNPDGGT